MFWMILAFMASAQGELAQEHVVYAGVVAPKQSPWMIVYKDGQLGASQAGSDVKPLGSANSAPAGVSVCQGASGSGLLWWERGAGDEAPTSLVRATLTQGQWSLTRALLEGAAVSRVIPWRGCGAVVLGQDGRLWRWEDGEQAQLVAALDAQVLDLNEVWRHAMVEVERDRAWVGPPSQAKLIEVELMSGESKAYALDAPLVEGALWSTAREQLWMLSRRGSLYQWHHGSLTRRHEGKVGAWSGLAPWRGGVAWGDEAGCVMTWSVSDGARCIYRGQAPIRHPLLVADVLVEGQPQLMFLSQARLGVLREDGSGELVAWREGSGDTMIWSDLEGQRPWVLTPVAQGTWRAPWAAYPQRLGASSAERFWPGATGVSVNVRGDVSKGDIDGDLAEVVSILDSPETALVFTGSLGQAEDKDDGDAMIPTNPSPQAKEPLLVASPGGCQSTKGGAPLNVGMSLVMLLGVMCRLRRRAH